MHHDAIANMPPLIQAGFQMESADSKSQNGIKGSGKTKCIDKVMEKSQRSQFSVTNGNPKIPGNYSSEIQYIVSPECE